METREMPIYECHKKVRALKIKNITYNDDGGVLISPADTDYAPFSTSKEYFDKHKPEIGGYYVVYEDGYKSFSPADAFEEGYTKVD